MKLYLSCVLLPLLVTACAQSDRVFDAGTPMAASAVGAPFPPTVIERENNVSAFAIYFATLGCTVTTLEGIIIGENNQSTPRDPWVRVGFSEYDTCTSSGRSSIYEGPPPATLRALISPSLQGAELIGTVELIDAVTGTSEVATVDFRWVPTGPANTDDERTLDVKLPWIGVVSWTRAMFRPTTNTASLVTPTRSLYSASLDQVMLVSLVKSRFQTLWLHQVPD